MHAEHLKSTLSSFFF